MSLFSCYTAISQEHGYVSISVAPFRSKIQRKYPENYKIAYEQSSLWKLMNGISFQRSDPRPSIIIGVMSTSPLTTSLYLTPFSPLIAKVLLSPGFIMRCVSSALKMQSASKNLSSSPLLRHVDSIQLPSPQKINLLCPRS